MSAVCLEYNLTYPRGPHGGGLAGWTVLDVVGAPAASFMSALCPGAGLQSQPVDTGQDTGACGHATPDISSAF